MPRAFMRPSFGVSEVAQGQQIPFSCRLKDFLFLPALRRVQPPPCAQVASSAFLESFTEQLTPLEFSGALMTVGMYQAAYQ